MSLHQHTHDNLLAFALEAMRRGGRRALADASISPGEVEQEMQRRAAVIREMEPEKLASQLLLDLPLGEFHRC